MRVSLNLYFMPTIMERFAAVWTIHFHLSGYPLRLQAGQATSREIVLWLTL